MKPSYRLAYVRDLMEQWLDRAERCLQHFPLLRSFYNGVLICRLGITSPLVLLSLLLLAALLALLLAVGMVGASVEWWAGVMA